MLLRRGELVIAAALLLAVTIAGAYLLARIPDPPVALRLLTALCGAGAVHTLRLAAGRGAQHTTTLGSAALAAPADDLLVDPRDPRDEPGSILVGHYKGRTVTLPRPLALRHGLLVGPSGAGKSRSFFLPNAARLAGSSCVLTDPKSELWRYTSGLHPAAERYAPTDWARSRGFNWVPLCRDARYAEIIARAFMESGNVARTEQAWLDMEAALLGALFAHAATLPIPTPLTAYRLLTRSKEAELMKALESSDSPVAREQAGVFGLASDRIRGAIFPVVAGRLQFLRDASVARFCSAVLVPPDFGRLRHSPVALYWCLPEQDSTRLRPLSSVFFAVLLDQLVRAGSGPWGEPGGGQEGGAWLGPEGGGAAVPVTLLLDEFGTLGTIPDFDATVSVARGRGLALWLGVQNLSQLTARYGKDAAHTILANCHTRIALAGLEGDSAEYFSRLAGQQTVWGRQRGRDRVPLSLWSRSLSDGEGEQGRPLLTPDEVRRLGTDEMLVIQGNRQPVRLTRQTYDPAPCTARTKPLGFARAMPRRSH